jgi:DNA-binding transcriptional ArsR family regulator
MSSRGTRSDAGESAEADAVFEVLANRRRRLVVRVLEDASGSLDIGELATRVAARERGVDPSEVTYRQRKSAYTALHQNHLPMLADVGVVAAEREWVDVGLTDRAPLVASHLQRHDGEAEDPSFRSAAVGMGVCTAVPVALSAAVSPLVVAAVATGVLLATLAWYASDAAGA